MKKIRLRRAPYRGSPYAANSLRRPAARGLKGAIFVVVRVCVVNENDYIYVFLISYKNIFACGGAPTGGRLTRRAASGGPLRGG